MANEMKKTDEGVATSSTSTKAPMAVKSNPPFKLSNTRQGSKYIKLLVYAKPGAGKTTLAASSVDVEAMRDVFMIDAESGELILENNDRIKHPELIERVEINTFMILGKIYEYLSAHVMFRDRYIADPNDKEALQKLIEFEAWLKQVPADTITEPKLFFTVIIDSLTEVEAYCMQSLLGFKEDFDAVELFDTDQKTAEFAEYKKNNNMVNRIIRAFRDLKMNLIIVCGAQYTQDEQKRMNWTPDLTGKLTNQIQGYFDVVGFMQTGTAADGVNAPRRLYVQPVGRFAAKNRLAIFKEAYFDDPTMSDLVKAFRLGKA